MRSARPRSTWRSRCRCGCWRRRRSGCFWRRRGAGGRWYRVAVYLPTVMPDLALALFTLWVFNPVSGPVNRLLGVVGLPQPNWFGSIWGSRVGDHRDAAAPDRRGVPGGARVPPADHRARSTRQRRWMASGPWRPAAPRHAAVAGARAGPARGARPGAAPAGQLRAGLPADRRAAGQRDAVPAALHLRPGLRVLGLGYGAFLTLVLLAVTVVIVAAGLLLARRAAGALPSGSRPRPARAPR